MLGVPVFVFHEGGEPIAARALKEIARLSGGAYCCLEPVSHVTDAFNLAANGVGGTGYRSLLAGERIAATVRMSVI